MAWYDWLIFGVCVSFYIPLLWVLRGLPKNYESAEQQKQTHH